jgi:hypothetical protein
MKKYKVVLLPKAQQELEEAVLWYEEQQANIGIKLIECFENALKTLESSSEIFVRKHKQYRELLIPIFPYLFLFFFSILQDFGNDDKSFEWIFVE